LNIPESSEFFAFYKTFTSIPNIFSTRDQYLQNVVNVSCYQQNPLTHDVLLILVIIPNILFWMRINNVQNAAALNGRD
jgi:hypothetical protein